MWFHARAMPATQLLVRTLHFLCRLSYALILSNAAIVFLPLPCPDALESADAEGVTVRQALEHAGLDPSPAALRSAAIPPEQVTH